MRISLLLVAAFLMGCGSNSVGEAPVIGHKDDYQDALEKAESLSRDALHKINLDEELNAKNKADLTEAAVQFEALVKYQPRQFAPYLALGMIYRGLGNPDAAEKNLRKCLHHLPPADREAVRATSNEAHYQLSRALFDLGRYDEALGAADTAAHGDPNNPNYLVGKASAYTQLNLKEEALKALKAALKLDPGHRRAQGLMKLLNRSAGA